MVGPNLKFAPSASVPSVAGPSIDERVGLIQEFRRQARLPALPVEVVAGLEAEGPGAVASAQVDAARAFLAGINPAFSAEETPESRVLDSPELAGIKKAVRAARQTLAEARIQGLRESLSSDGKLDVQAVDRAFTGSAKLSAAVKRLPKAVGKSVLDFAADGAPRQAIEHLSRLRKGDTRFSGRQGKAAVQAVEEALYPVAESRDVAELSLRLGRAKGLLSKGRYAEAMAAARNLLADLKISGLGDATRRFFGVEAAGLETAAQEKGSLSIYGRLGIMSPPRLAEHVRALAKGDPSAYAGELPSADPTRIQCYGDCAIQQAYNHPRLALLSEQMPYETFLSAVEAYLEGPARHEGLNSVEEGMILGDFGLARVSRGSPKTADEAAALLRRHGALMLSVRWGKLEGLKDLHGNHAVILQGAFREHGRWNFVMVDSNHSRPQVFSFEELGLLGATGFDSVEVVPSGPRLPEVLAGIADPSARMRRAVNLFYGNYGAVRRYLPWYKRLIFSPLNFLAEKLGWEPFEPSPSEKLDANLIPLSRQPAAIREAAKRGLKLPPEAFVTAPDGRRFLNRLVAERFLEGS